jgi:cholesterol oxidase
MTWDWIVIGSGFGGSVSALRLAQKGYSVLVLEKGRRWQDTAFPRTNWNLRRWLWMPALGFRGFFKMTFLRHITALSGVGVGGGSLVYANTLPIPPAGFFRARAWGEMADWASELAPHYETARRMLGVVENPLETPPDRALKGMARTMGLEGEVQPAPVGVFFGEPGVEHPDPYFDGEGPSRQGCTHCGGCMTGCRYGAKNTLEKNYLWLAEKRGVTIQPETEVVWVRPSAAGYAVTAEERTGPFRKRTQVLEARNVVFAGGVLGTVPLLLKLRESPQGLPGLSPRVGDRVRTNSEVLVGVTTLRKDLDLSQGVAITSTLKTDAQSHLEPVRFSSGSGLFRVLAMPHSPGSTFLRRMATGLLRVMRAPLRTLRAMTVRDWAKRTTALLYMRTREGFLRLGRGGMGFPLRRRRLVSEKGRGPLPTVAIPEATDLAEAYAREVDGQVGSLLTETVLGIPTTAHILGGACMGRTLEEGVIDLEHRVFGYEGLYVIDGSAVSANPGVNPSLTITAMAERALTLIPLAGTSQDPGKSE